ncbi:unnamed protein product [Sphagnum troendelagicum]|uniref:Gamma-butyrobetaine hydroxylase-like N-terminal domain-containing protein n=1 Tax=Sphagnum troendelagicum TaxID=128251 RepID=A0ABP0UC37_9BRYO
MVLREVMALDVEFDIGKKYSYSAEFLCVHSPAANSNCISLSGEVKVVSGRRHVAIMLVEPVRNYGIRNTFDDLHNIGIYIHETSFTLLGDPTSPAAAYTLDIKTDFTMCTANLMSTMNPVSKTVPTEAVGSQEIMLIILCSLQMATAARKLNHAPPHRASLLQS